MPFNNKSQTTELISIHCTSPKENFHHFILLFKTVEALASLPPFAVQLEHVTRTYLWVINPVCTHVTGGLWCLWFFVVDFLLFRDSHLLDFLYGPWICIVACSKVRTIVRCGNHHAGLGVICPLWPRMPKLFTDFTYTSYLQPNAGIA